VPTAPSSARAGRTPSRGGTPLAVTDAGSQSRPILARLGFREICTIRALVDRFALRGA